MSIASLFAHPLQPVMTLQLMQELWCDDISHKQAKLTQILNSKSNALSTGSKLQKSYRWALKY